MVGAARAYRRGGSGRLLPSCFALSFLLTLGCDAPAPPPAGPSPEIASPAAAEPAPVPPASLPADELVATLDGLVTGAIARGELPGAVIMVQRDDRVLVR